MPSFLRSTAVGLWIALGCVCLSTLPVLAQVSVRSVKVLGGKDSVEIEVEASERIVPETRVLTGPDRLVVDFPNAIPGNQVRSQSVNRGEVRDVRVGLFQSKPPVTRVVLDLKSARSYQIFPSGRTVMIKVMGGSGAADESAATTEAARRPGYVPATFTTGRQAVQLVNTSRPPLEVTFRKGLLSIVANRATLSEVLYAVQQRTGAEISIPAGAEQERVVAEFEPGPAPVVLARLLNGSSFNFLILSAPDDPNHVDRVVLSPRDSGAMPLAPMQPEVEQASQDDANNEPAIPAPAPKDVASAPVPQPLPEPDAAPTPGNDGSPEN
jgi:AMIN domain